MTIRVYVRSVYGKPLVYVSDPVQAEALRLLTGAATLTERHLSALRRLGFQIEQEQAADPTATLPGSAPAS